MRVLLALVLLLAGLSGCSDGDASEPPEPQAQDPAVAPDAVPSHPGGDGIPPFRVKTSTVPGTELGILFRIQVQGETAGLEWSLDADGDGSADAGGGSLPADVDHVYERAGSYDAVVTVLRNETSRDLTVPVEVVESVVLRGTTTVVSGPHKRETGHTDCAGFQAGEDGLDCIWFGLDGTDGWRFAARTEPGAPSADVEFLTACDARATASLGIHVDNADGTVPEGAGCALLWAFGANTATLTLTLTP